MSKTLVFKDREVIPFDNKDGKIWFTNKQLSILLEYKDESSITRIFNRNKDEFTVDMSQTVNLTESNKNNELKYKKIRIYSVRGAHLIGMLSKTKVAKSLRKWLLDLAEKENQPGSLSLLDMEGLKSLTINEMQNRVVAVDKWSSATFGRPGSKMMNVRKGHLKKLREAEKTIMALSQLTLPGFEDSTGGESPA
ncbi:MAG TPA: hypothetical protein ACHBX6_10590 [Arsenophonus nasoniae]|uniref:hypothetical protein n=1 Tax=Arsenophonus nasoniae TaxID=638 RepID=UPI0038797989